MKKLLLLFSFLTSLFAANAQSGTDCSNAIPFVTTFSIHDSVVMGEGKYYSFIAQSEKVKIDLEILNSQYKNYFKLYLFGGSCVGNSLTVIDNLKIEPLHDTLISLNDSNLIIGNTYYVYVGRGWWAGGDTTTTYNLNVINTQDEATIGTIISTDMGICGYNSSKFADPTLRLVGGNGVSPASMSKASYPASAIFNCGKFQLYYEDVALGNGIGFDEGAGVGAMRRNTLCQVYQYVQSIFDFYWITVGDPITIEIQQTPPAGSVTYLAAANPVYPNSTLPGIYKGSVLSHSLPPYTSPSPALFDGILVINFESFDFYSDLPLPNPNCDYDLFSICLHEVGHQLGFGSLLKEDGGQNPVSGFGNNQYTLFDWKNIYHGDINTAVFEKLVGGTMAAPQINPAIVIPTNYLRDEKLWLNNKPRFRDNLPIYSGIFHYGMQHLTIGSVASHLDGEYVSFTKRYSFSPGFRKKHSMQPFFDFGEVRREYSEQEIRIFLQLGYFLTPVYASSTSINGINTNWSIITANKTPYTTKQVTSTKDGGVAQQSFPDMTQPADFTISNNGTPLVINLATDPTLFDLDGDPRRVENNTLYNIRGCGSGNNHDQLTVTGGTIITYTPRTNFIGRAQFGFYLSDGKERGSYMVYTINVTSGSSFVNTPNVNTTAGSTELIINGDYEEGIEIRRSSSVLEESIPNASAEMWREEGLYFTGAIMSDAHPLQYVNTGWSSSNGIVVGNSNKGCSEPTTPIRFGSDQFSYPNFTPPINPTPVTGYRYSLLRLNHNYNAITTPLQQCNRYIAKFDVNFSNSGLALGSVFNFNLHINNAINYPTNTATQIIPVSITVGSGWQTITVPFTYCSNIPGNYLNFVNMLLYFPCGIGLNCKTYYDNVSLIADPSPAPPLNVSIANSFPSYCAGSGSSSILTSVVTNGLCDVTYSWAPGGATTSSIIVSPASTTTYTLTVNDGCSSTVSNTTVTIPLPIVTATPSLQSICSESATSVALTSNISGSTFAWTVIQTNVSGATAGSGNSIAQTLTATTLTAGTAVYTITPTANGCLGAPITVVVTVNPLPIATAAPSLQSICSGSAMSTALTSNIAGSTFAWTVTQSNTSGASPGSGNNIAQTLTTTSSTAGTAVYTITPTANGCLGAPIIVVVTVNPLPIVTATPSSQSICFGSSTSTALTSNIGGTTFAWTVTQTNVSGATTGNGNSIAQALTATTLTAGTAVYTITPTADGCLGAPITVVVTVNPLPTAIATPSLQPICSGSTTSIALTSNIAGSNFTWTVTQNNVSGATAGGGNNIAQILTATTLVAGTAVYTITPTVNGCFGTPITVIATVTPTPAITASASPTTVVAGNPVTLTTNATSAIWTPGGAGSTITVNPTTTTTYTVNGNDPITGCPGTATVTVNVIAACPATNTLAANYNASTTLSGTTGFWAASAANTTITGSATLTLSGIQLRMSQNFKITVTSGCTLKIIGTKIWACTDDMWTGIEVQAGGRVEINTDSRIEDAIIAVHIMNTATTEAQFDIHQCVFNKNHKSLVVDPYPNPHSGIVYSTLFTSAASVLPQLGILGGLTTLKNPYVSSIARRANMGVEIRNVKSITIGSTLGQNIFSNLEVGIHSFQNTTLYSKNNKFQNITYAKNCPWTMPSCFLQSTTGMGIWAEELGTIVVGGSPSEVNIFVKSNNGIVAKKDINVYASFNTFQQMSSPSLTQSRCIYVEKETGGQVVLINDNTFKDFKDGVLVNFYGKSKVDILHNDFKKFNYQPVYLGPYTVYAGSIAIHCVQNTNSKLNILTNSFNNSAADNGYNAIRVENVIPFNNDAINISTNDIINCTIGIKNANVIKVQVLQNNVRYTITSPPLATCFGIWNNNCQYGSITNNRVYKVGTTAGSTFNNLLYGYATDAGCNFSSVVDNKAQNLNTGYRFAGSANLPNTYTCNFIQNNYTGLELNTTNIGNQGVAGSIAEDNQWTLPNPLTYLGTFGAYNNTFTVPSFYTRGSATPWGLNFFQQYNTGSGNAVNFTVTTATNYTCLYGCPNPPCSHAPIARMAKKMAPYDMLSVDNTDITYFNTYYVLKSDSTIYQSGTPDDVTIINFKDSLALTNTGAFYEVSDKMTLADTVQAKIKNDAIVPKNCKEQSLQIVNKIYLSTWANGKFEFSASDSLSLFTIANYSVEDCGIAVYIARVMMRIDKNDYPRLQSRMAMQESEIIDDGFGLMYPNPAQNEAYYKTTLDETEKGYIELININGQVVSKTILVSGENTVKINLTELSNGLYLYRIIINGEQRTSNKLIIQK